MASARQDADEPSTIALDNEIVVVPAVRWDVDPKTEIRSEGIGMSNPESDGLSIAWVECTWPSAKLWLDILKEQDE